MSTSPTSQTAGRTGSPSALSFTTSSLRWTTFTDSWHGFGGNFCNKTYGLKKTFSRPLTTQSWQRRTESKITNSPSRLESKFQRQSSLFRFVYPKQFCKLDEQGKAWNIETTSQVSNDLNDQKISGYPRLHLRGRHGRDDQFWKARPQSGLCLRPGGLQGPQGQLSKRSCSFDRRRVEEPGLPLLSEGSKQDLLIFSLSCVTQYFLWIVNIIQITKCS